MHKAKNGHEVLSLKSLCVNYHAHTNEVSQTAILPAAGGHRLLV